MRIIMQFHCVQFLVLLFDGTKCCKNGGPGPQHPVIVFFGLIKYSLNILIIILHCDWILLQIKDKICLYNDFFFYKYFRYNTSALILFSWVHKFEETFVHKTTVR